MFSVLEANIFQYGFLEEHKACENNRHWSSMYIVAIMATKPELLASKKDILAAVVTVSVAILVPGMAIKLLYLC